MKLIKGLGILSFLIIIAGSCFDPPEFPIIPQIEFQDIEFIGAKQPGDLDTLNLYLRFKDGDGNLGFNDGSRDISNPFHDVFFYQENTATGKVEPLTKISGVIGEDEYDLLEITDPDKGKLVTFRTRQKPGFGFLPGGESCSGSNNLKHYEYLGGPVVKDPNNPGQGGGDGRRLLILARDRAVLDPRIKLVDSIPNINPEYYQIRDTLYFTPNQGHYNIEVDFFVKEGGGFTEFDWREQFCTTFDGRFPVFSDSKNSIDGELKYIMTSFGFKALFSIKTLKLRVRITDYLGNVSEPMETREFTLVP
jgi:hypothetical protein